MNYVQASNNFSNSDQAASTPFLTFFGAVFVAAWVGGFWPGVVATLLSAFLSNFFFIMPAFSILPGSLKDVVNTLIFIMEGVLFSKLCDVLRKSLNTARREIIARKEVETELRKQREEFAVTLASIGDAVIATDTQNHITFINEIAQKLTGWNQEEARGKPLEEVFRIVNEYTRQTVENPVIKVLREGIIVGLANHTVLLARDGREIPIDDSAAPIREESGQITGVVLVFRDVTERKKIEERERFLAQTGPILAGSLDYQITMQNIADLVVPYMADWCTVHILEEQTETQNDSPPEQVALAHKDPAMVDWARQLQKELADRYPYNPDAPTGLPKVLRTGQPELYPDLPDEMFVAASLDEEVLQVVRQIGYASAMIVPLIARDRVLGAIQFVTTKESGRHYTNEDLAFAQELAGRAALAVDNARLYREAQRAIETQKELDRLKDRFLSIAGHELRTPLTSIKGFTQLLQRQLSRPLPPEAVQQKISGTEVVTLDDNSSQADSTLARPKVDRTGRILDNISNQVNRMDVLIREMLDMSRIQSGRLDLKLIPGLNLVELVRRVIEQQRVAYPDRTILLETSLDEIIGTFDEARLEQVISNLINNAIKYSPPQCPVRVGLALSNETAGAELAFKIPNSAFSTPVSAETRSDNHKETNLFALVWVQDEGFGISEADQTHIFESFYRARAEQHPSIDGLGLGLFISNQIVTQHAGKMGVKSRLNEGSIFYFFLPLNPVVAEG
jgi:PAS domain S-box-containing protein